MYFVKTPTFIRRLFPKLTWKMPVTEKVLYLTFDDGPHPQITPWVLAQLEKHKAKATFFCIGENVQKYPDIYQQILEQGHAVGNHTYHHLNGWMTNNKVYYENIAQCTKLVNSSLFRPPYGRLTPWQIRQLRKDYRIIMWDVMSGDFDPTISKEQCLKNVLDNIEAGSIVVFHDSLKAEEKLRYVLPRILECFNSKNGYFLAQLAFS